MRSLISTHILLQTKGKIIRFTGMYVRNNSQMPVVGESIQAVCKQTGKKYPGHVTAVDLDEHRYDAEFDLTEAIQ